MPVRPEYIFRIGVTYVKIAADNTEIASDDAVGKKWKDAYKTFKPRIKNHLKHQQHARCAFCRCIVSEGTGYPNLEHIVSKTDYPQFKTLPENLVFCCWLCNKSKSKKNTIHAPIANKEAQTFPMSSNGFVIINPYHDNYEDHIDFLDEVLIVEVTNSTKGANTIEFYQLARPKLAEDRAREFKLNQNQITHQLTQRLTHAATSINVLQQVNDIVADMPNWEI